MSQGNPLIPGAQWMSWGNFGNNAAILQAGGGGATELADDALTNILTDDAGANILTPA